MRSKSIPAVLFLTFVFAVLSIPTVLATDTANDAPRFGDYLPEETLVVLSIADFDEIKAVIQDPKMMKLLEATGLKEKIDEALQEMQEEFAGDYELFTRLYDSLTGHITIGVINFSLEGDADIVFLAGVTGGEALFADLLSKAKEQVGDEEKFLQKYIGDIEVTQVIDGPTVAFHADQFMLATNIESMEKALVPEKPLTAADDFQRHLELTRMSGGIVAYANVAGLMEKIEGFMDPEDTESKWAELVISLLGLRDIRSASLMISLDESEPSRMFFMAPSYDGVLTDFFSGEPVGINKAALIPADSDTCSLISIQDPIEIMDAVIDLVEEINPQFNRDQFNSMLGPVEEALGISLRDDFVGPMGTVMGSSIKMDPDADIDLESPEEFFKVMNFEMFISLDDPERFLEAFRKISAASMNQLVEEEYEGAALFSVVAPMAPFPMGFAVYENALLFSFDVEYLKSVINALETGQSILRNEEFQYQVVSVPQDACLLTYASHDYLNKAYSAFASMWFDVDEETETGMTSAILEYLGEKTGGVSYAKATGDGLYMECNIPFKTIVAMVPVWAKMIEKLQGHDDEDTDWDEEYEYEDEEEAEEEEEEPPVPDPLR
jgi:hypothetical protein